MWATLLAGRCDHDQLGGRTSVAPGVEGCDVAAYPDRLQEVPMLGVLTGEHEALDPVDGPRRLLDRRFETVDVEGLVSSVDPALELSTRMGVVVLVLFGVEPTVGPILAGSGTDEHV